MTFLPIVERELRVAARRRGTYGARTISAVAAIALCAWILIALGQVAGAPAFGLLAQGGAQLFRALSWLAFFYALITGVRLTSDCLSEEKREGTLGLLFLTDLKGYDVVLGKLVATSLNGAYGFLAMMPVLAIPMLMGGVTAGDFWRMCFALGDTLFLSLAAGIFVSCVSRIERKAMGGTVLLLFLLVCLPPFLGAVLAGGVMSSWLENPVQWISPWFCFLLASGSGSMAPVGVDNFWCSLFVIHTLGWLLLALASRIVPHVWKDKPGSRRIASWRRWWHDLLFGSAEYRVRLRRRLFAINPICWLSSRERLSRAYPWFFLGAMAVIWLVGCISSKGELLQPGPIWSVSYFLHAIFKYWFATLACHSFAEDRNQGALELLLSTPLTIKEMLRGQWLALWRCLGWPIIAIIGSDVVLYCVSLYVPQSWWQRSDKELWGLALGGNLVMFVVDLVTLGWVGMWTGVNSKNAQHAASKTVGRVLALPCLVAYLCGVLTSLMVSRPSNNFEFVLFAVWVVAGVCADAVFGPWAYLKLHEELRRVAALRYAAGRESKPWWRVALSG